MTFIGSYKVFVNNEEFIYSIADSQVLLIDGLLKKISSKGKQKIKYIENKNILILNTGVVRPFESILNLDINNLDDFVDKFINLNNTIKDDANWKVILNGINKTGSLDIYYIENIKKIIKSKKISFFFAGSGFRFAEKEIELKLEQFKSDFNFNFDNFIDPLVFGHELLNFASKDKSTNNKLQFSVLSKLGFSVLHEPNIKIENDFYDKINFNLDKNKYKTSKSFLDDFHTILISHLNLYILNKTKIILKEDLNNLIKYFILKQPQLFFEEYQKFSEKYSKN